MNIDQYKDDLDALLAKGGQLLNAIQYECAPTEFEEVAIENIGDKTQEFLRTLPSFKDEYQAWYSEAIALIRQLLPDRLPDFTRYYEKPKTRKEINYENYTIEDYLQGLTLTRAGSLVVGPDAAIPRFRQQMSIASSIRSRFESTLFELRQLAQADLFDSELDSAKELARNKFARPAGVIAGVVLERHLKGVCESHNVTVRKKHTIANLNDALKVAKVIDIPQWRSIQHLADLRNICAHDKGRDPTLDETLVLISEVDKVAKTVF